MLFFVYPPHSAYSTEKIQNILRITPADNAILRIEESLAVTVNPDVSICLDYMTERHPSFENNKLIIGNRIQTGVFDLINFAHGYSWRGTTFNQTHFQLGYTVNHPFYMWGVQMEYIVRPEYSIQRITPKFKYLPNKYFSLNTNLYLRFDPNYTNAFAYHIYASYKPEETIVLYQGIKGGKIECFAEYPADPEGEFFTVQWGISWIFGRSHIRAFYEHTSIPATDNEWISYPLDLNLVF